MNAEQERWLLTYLVNGLSASRDVGQGLGSQATQTQVDSDIQKYTAICQNAIAAMAAYPIDAASVLGAGETFGTSLGGLAVSATVAAAAAAAFANTCKTIASAAVLSAYNAQLNALTGSLSKVGSSYITTSFEQAQWNTLLSAANSGNFAAAVTAANNLAQTQAFLGTTNASGAIVFQSSSATLTVGPDWQPESFIQNGNGSSSNGTFNSDGSSVIYDYDGPNQTGSSTATMYNGFASITEVNLNNIALATGIQFTQDPVKVISTGTIATTGAYAIEDIASAADTFTNNGKWQGGYGVIVYGAASVVSNLGTITGTSGYGVFLLANGTVNNGSASDTTASITGSSAGIVIQGAPGPSVVSNYGTVGGYSGIFDTSTGPITVTNSGAVVGTNGSGISNGGAGTIANLGSIAGFNGISLAGGSNVTNGSSSDTTASITGTNLAITTGASSLGNYGKIVGAIQMSGTITNGSASDIVASIAGAINAIGVTTVGNFGSISGGIAMVAAGGNTVTNGSATDTTASISGSSGVVTAGGPPSTINNFGSITATYGGGSGIGASGSANIANGSAADPKALIQGGSFGWGAYVNAGSVINFGTIKGGEGCIYLGSGTITNAGMLAGATPTSTAIQFGSGVNKLIEDAGSTITGTIFGSSSSSLELANGGAPVSIGSNISGFGTLVVDAGVTWTVASAAAVPQIVDNGTVAIASGGSLDVSSAVDPSSSGIFQLMTKGSLEIGAILGTNLKIQFLGSGPTNKLTIDSAANFGTHVGSTSYAGPLLENFVAGDVIDLRSIGTAGLALNYSATSGDLQITGSGGAVATLAFQNSSLGGGAFHTAADGFGGILITHS